MLLSKCFPIQTLFSYQYFLTFIGSGFNTLSLLDMNCVFTIHIAAELYFVHVSSPINYAPIDLILFFCLLQKEAVMVGFEKSLVADILFLRAVNTTGMNVALMKLTIVK